MSDRRPGASRARPALRAPVPRLVVLGLALLTCGCPYEAAFLPAGDAVPLRSTLVGVWTCSLDAEEDWAELRIGWTSGPAYLLSFRSLAPPTESEVEVPTGPAGQEPHEETSAQVAIWPRRVAGREIWSWDWSEATRDAEAQYGFWELALLGSSRFALNELGERDGDSDLPDPSTPEELAARLVGPESTTESVMTCRRVDPGRTGPGSE